MKELYGWMRWTWSNWETWQRWFIVAIVFNFGSLVFSEPYNYYVNGCGIAIIGFFFVKWAVIDNFTRSWNKYKEHRNELFSTIKESDQR